MVGVTHGMTVRGSWCKCRVSSVRSSHTVTVNVTVQGLWCGRCGWARQPIFLRLMDRLSVTRISPTRMLEMRGSSGRILGVACFSTSPDFSAYFVCIGMEHVVNQRCERRESNMHSTISDVKRRKTEGPETLLGYTLHHPNQYTKNF